MYIYSIQTTADEERCITGTCCNLCLPDILTECNKEHNMVYATFCEYTSIPTPHNI